MIGIIDYNAGNLRSIQKAVELYDKVIITNNSEELLACDKIILPGVGNFGSAMENLAPLKETIYKIVDDRVPFLGICLGMQILFEESEEKRGIKGLGIIKGNVIKFKDVEKLPHMGWNSVKIVKDCPLFEGIKNNSYFYFVHSYHVNPDEDCIVGKTEYGREFPSVINKDNVFATQFHPEKSGKIGLKIIENFVELL
ncbi:imidazole glycerol phosphate synthase subunit HisH [Methanocaldococcus jannaschii]|uniref:Imidazole glycerol phosphate synthase subunit HisH n=1 Tax=Methanocaldococcus jannaschii (strain ATCC 43067 / DSM 2661 / JAL-1 / JCM 10045 / NBRC 100440) TaxID=243232 RepID=HIS5_METJA|nr:imidazole glycerol phosphate synthase subunit HisH [Methanocaldococcus jannaschii]Q57929.2 RecName: Full=Imidazole glycerol phosphate synthase subunit HisH; AltName: Full=IGP synthase glutaminase subunit; AltName: Full=IGP synthase subunit HisH; AltName: Full=ImGP synthase subunit HisH; Short=IGPS subunit HisH [Methanocaldococcus jannaschii DSM 2661]